AGKLYPAWFFRPLDSCVRTRHAIVAALSCRRAWRGVGNHDVARNVRAPEGKRYRTTFQVDPRLFNIGGGAGGQPTRTGYRGREQDADASEEQSRFHGNLLGRAFTVFAPCICSRGTGRQIGSRT